jgi:hypothetical protein
MVTIILLAISEVIVAAGCEWLTLKSDRSGAAFDNAADETSPARLRFARRQREEQLVVFTAMKGTFEGGPADAGNAVDNGCNAGCEAQAVEIERESVAEIHARCGSAAKGSAQF